MLKGSSADILVRLVAQKTNSICLENSILFSMRYVPSRFNISDGLTRNALKPRVKEALVSVAPNATEVKTDPKCRILEEIIAEFVAKAPDFFGRSTTIHQKRKGGQQVENRQ